MKHRHLLCHISVLCKHKQALVAEQQQPEPKHVEINRKDKWEFEHILKC